MALSAPDPLFAGWNPFSIAMTGRDWSGQQYEQVGLPAANGNEFLLQYVFFLGATASIAGVQVVNAAVQGEYDGSSSFATPMGPGASFPIPKLDLPPNVTGLIWEFAGVMSVGIGLKMIFLNTNSM